MTERSGRGRLKPSALADCRTDARTNRHKLDVWAEVVKHSRVTQATPIQQLDNVCDGWKLLQRFLRQVSVDWLAAFAMHSE